MSVEDTILIIVEPQAAWPRWVASLGERLSQAVVLAGFQDETPAELALRATRRLDSLARRGKRVVLGVVAAAGSAGDDHVFSARCAMARAFLQHMTLVGEGTLTLSASDRVPDAARHDLLDLAGTLTSQLAGTPLSVAVRFDAAELEARGQLEDECQLALA